MRGGIAPSRYARPFGYKGKGVKEKCKDGPVFEMREIKWEVTNHGSL